MEQKFIPQFEQKKNKTEELRSFVRDIARSVNEDVERTFGAKNLLDSSGAIRMDSFSLEKGGIYSEEKITKDREKMRDAELRWSGAHDLGMREFYRREHKIVTDNEIVAHWKREKQKGKNGQMEMLTIALLHKFLGKEFIVARTSEYDDYFGGTDLLIINKKTGDVVCAFDEVHNHMRSDREEEKWEKIKRTAKGGGTTLKYAVVPEHGVLRQTSIKNIPIFFLSLTTEEIERLMDKMSMDMKHAPNEIEIQAFSKFLVLLEEEKGKVKKLVMPQEEREHMQKFERVLERMKEIREEARRE